MYVQPCDWNPIRHMTNRKFHHLAAWSREKEVPSTICPAQRLNFVTKIIDTKNVHLKIIFFLKIVNMCLLE